MAARITVPLGRPVTVDGMRHEALHLRPVKGRDLKAVRGGFAGEVGVALTARLANVPVAVIYSLNEEDAGRVGGIVKAMLDQAL